jgi:GNAT superfamily N-acetyltransferase
VTIRRATPGDAEAIARVHVAAWHATYRGLMPDALLDGFTVAVRTARWRDILAAPAADARTWVVLVEAAVVGFLSTSPTRDADRDRSKVSEVTALYVEPGRVGSGLGRALMDHALADVRDRGSTEVDLWVLDGNARAERFYGLAGFARGLREVKTVQGASLPHTRWTRQGA